MSPDKLDGNEDTTKQSKSLTSSLCSQLWLVEDISGNKGADKLLAAKNQCHMWGNYKKWKNLTDKITLALV